MKQKWENPITPMVFFKKALEDDKDYKLLPKREKLRAQFDGVAYTTAVSNCIGRYDADYINPKTDGPLLFWAFSWQSIKTV